MEYENRTSITIFALASCIVARAQKSAPWQDLSKHQVRFVTVEAESIWRCSIGAGLAARLCCWLATIPAHVYDDFAAKLPETCHVYGITRRGLGASSRPGSGYTTQRSTDDIRGAVVFLNCFLH